MNGKQAGEGGTGSSRLAQWIPLLLALRREAFSPADTRSAHPVGASRRHRQGSFLDRSEIASIARSLLAVQRGLTGARTLAGAPYMERRELLESYLCYYWPVSYLQTSLALEEVFRDARAPCAEGGRVLDLGAGPGPASAAFLDRGCSDFVLVDSSGSALDLARRLLMASSRDKDGSPPRISTRVADLERPPLPASGTFDFVVLGHCLNELWQDEPDRMERRIRLLEALIPLVAPGGILIAIEPALLATSRDLLELRDALLSRRAEASAIAPCPPAQGRPARYPCPAFAAGSGRTCHAENPWSPPEPVASIAREAGLDRSSVKSAWMAFSFGGGSDGRGLANPAGEPGPAIASAGMSGRIVSDPMLNKAGRLRFILCSEGRLSTVSAAARDPAATAQGFPFLVRGDVVRFTGMRARNREDGAPPSWGFDSDSRLEVLAPAPSADPPGTRREP